MVRTYDEIGSTIKERRLAMRLSQKFVAEAIGYKNAQLISNIERGMCSLPLKNLNTTATVLNMNPGILANAIIMDQIRYMDKVIKEK